MSQKLNLDLNAAIGLAQYDTPFLRADWPAPAQVKTLLTTRKGGVSKAPCAGLNVGAQVGDAPADVAHQRARVAAEAGRPVLFCDRAGTVVGAAHAGWRGLAAGVLENTVAAMGVPAAEIMAYLGPAIGPDAFEVGQDVFDTFCLPLPQAEAAFEPIGGGKYLADIYALARLRLQREGVTQIYGGTHCTVLERDTFFSYRRDGQTGRMVSLIWLEKPEG